MLDRLGHSRNGPGPVAQRLWILGSLVVFSGIGLLVFLRSIFMSRRTRYEIGASELVVQSGVIWQTTKTLPLLEITRIELTSGPLMRLFGLSDLRLHAGNVRESASATLLGLRDAEELKTYLLDRRETLRESALEGDYRPPNPTWDLLLGRLTRVVERLDRSLPGAKV